MESVSVLPSIFHMPSMLKGQVFPASDWPNVGQTLVRPRSGQTKVCPTKKMSVSEERKTTRFIATLPSLSRRFCRRTPVFLKLLVSHVERFVEAPHLFEKQERNPRRRDFIGDS